jgi:sec-independent protein translocase protein TatA
MIQVHLLFISGVEIAFILFFVLLVFGADKIPEIARGLGKGIRQVKDATSDIKSEISKQMKDDVEDIGGSIKRKF